MCIHASYRIVTKARALVVFLAIATGLQLAVVAAQDDIYRVSGNLVSIHADQASLHPLLEQLASQAGFKLWIADGVPSQMVSISVNKQPVDQALRRLLADSSFALVYDDAEKVSALYVLPPGGAQPEGRVIKPVVANRQQQLVQDALASQALPDEIKAAIFYQMGADGEELRATIESQRGRAVESLVERLVEMGDPSAETIRQLNQKIAEIKAGQNE